jgi:excisionase family DNA binding protein
VNVRVEITDEDVERIARRVTELLAERGSSSTVWLDVAGAAAHLRMTKHAIRALVKRHQLPTHRTTNGRLRFDRDELDEWARRADS